MGVFRVGGRGVVEDARPRLPVGALDLEPAGHAQMHDERVAAIERGQEIFRPPRQVDNPRAGQPLHKAFRQWKAQIGPVGLHALEHGVLKRGP